ncbi:MAG: FtsK/SpoIIIE domain-containing protein [Thermomicrobiales bacterium]|nr:FtsK/SpoIIIE domain-containing protein [Thermomicrobiales bacterium]MCO5227157.1 FtsK/SpoIIIE domain-containing protein [Thermomicrobiales bacterium]
MSAINASYSIPAAIALPAGMSFLLLAPSTSGATIDETLVVRIVQAFPPGRLRLTLFDPVGNGSNFAGLMHLGEHNPALIGSAAWVDSRHIEEQLASLSEQMRTIIQKYLRRDYETMEEYNAAAQQIEEPYRLLVINNFPTGFSQNAINSLRHILSNGRRAGIYTMIALDQSAELPRGFKVSELEAAVNHVIYRGADGDKIAAAGTSYKAEFQPLEPLPNAVVKAILEQISQESLAVGNVVVPFTDVAPSTDKWWTGNSQDSLSPVVGFHGARKPQQINLGRNTLGGDLNNGALIVGRVGSGKSTLLHSIIMGLATQYGPDELELYLIDSKQGIEFNTYARHHLPHARAISVETEPEFTASVILRLAEEMEIRAKRIKARVGETGSSQNIRGFREISDEKMPRVVLVIDEFQELYRESSPRITAAQQALEQIIRQGRAYGIHLILATQTFGGGVGMPKAIRELVAVRIAMMSSESDAAMIFQDDNTEARLLDRPGEAILNENFGKVESNQRFQTAWMESDERDELLEQLRAKADAEFPMLPKPSVFFGGTSSALAENPALATVAVGGTPRVWLGTSIAIEPDYEVALSQKAGANLLMVGTQEATLGMLVSAVTAAAITSPTAIIRIVDAGGEDAGITDHLEALTSLSDRDIRVVAQRSAPAIIEEIDTELTRRLEMDSTRTLPAIVLVLPMIDRVRSLRRDANSGYGTSATEFNPVKAFARILTEGAEVGIHVIAQAESLSSLNRVLTAQQLDQFDTRVVTQVSREDSQRLIDNPEASNLGENRAVVFQDDRNRRSKIKPYGLPDLDWMKQVLTQSRKVAD